MPGRKLVSMVLGTCLCAAIGGCEAFKNGWPFKGDAFGKPPAGAAASTQPIAVPPHVAGTVGEYARLVGGTDLLVQGYGLVVGLGTNGSSEVPPQIKEYMLKYLGTKKIFSHIEGGGGVSPSQVLQDLDTAVVLVAGNIAPGAPEGTGFDVYVSALPQTSTRSLDGGILMPIELHLAVGGIAMPGGPSKALAVAGGSIFINPFLDAAQQTEQVKLRAGRIPGGGKVAVARPVRLQLIRPDYALCDLLQRRINARFSNQGATKVANALNPAEIALVIPRACRDDYAHFLALITHLPLRSGPGEWEMHAREVAKAMELPTARHEELALVWEAMGRQVVPVLRPLYTSRNPPTAFWSGVAGMRLGDDMAADVVIRFATVAGSAIQLFAIEELGRHPMVTRAAGTLRQLVDDDNELVRIAAYDALSRRGDTSVIARVETSPEFKLDLVTSQKGYVIYALQTGQPRIVLFGKNMTVTAPIFFSSPDDLVTINANAAGDKLTVFRKIPRSGKVSDPFVMEPYVRTLAEKLGAPPRPGENGQIMGMGLTYSQVIGVLQRLCKENDINAKLVLQPLPGVQRIYSDVITTGRPDMPGP